MTYGALPPGSYRFRVTGTGSEGMWNEEGASFAFDVAPVFWRAWWFRLTMLAFGSLIVAAVYQLRMRQLARQFNLALDARVSERTRIARELHDTLLQSFQGVLLKFHAITYMIPDRPEVFNLPPSPVLPSRFQPAAYTAGLLAAAAIAAVGIGVFRGGANA